MNFRETNEDLFETSRMSFGEHLEDLRKVLVKSLIGVAICCGIGFMFATQVVQILKEPLVEAMAEYNRDDATRDIIARKGYVAPELEPWLTTDRYIPRVLQVDPAELVAALRHIIPDFGANINLEPYGYRASDFDAGRLPQLCERLSRHDHSDPVIATRELMVWRELSDAQQQTVIRIANSSAADSDDINALVKIFTDVSKNGKLYDAEEFSDLVNKPESNFWSFLDKGEDRPLAEMKAKLVETNDDTISRRLNRALLTGVFSGSMPVLKMEMIPIEFWERSDFEPLALGVSEGFMVWIKAGILSGLILAGPWVFYQLWSFVAVGLYPHEQKYIHIFLPMSIALFVAGVLLAFFFVFQPVLGFLFSFNRQMGIAPQMRINDWLSFVMFLPLGFGLAFQLPLVMLFMNRIGLFQVADYLSKWRIAVMLIFVAAMVLTPADPISMLLLALPLTILYFLGIAMCHWMPRDQNPFGESEQEYTSTDPGS